MMARLARFVTVLAALSAVSPAAAQQEKPSIAGTWSTAFVDRVLGRVQGKALVSEDESKIRLILTHPVSGGRFTLNAENISRTADKLTMDLVGVWPGSEGFVDDPLGKPVPVAPGDPYAVGAGTTISLRLGNASGTFEQLAHDADDGDRVRLELTVRDGVLSGRWRQNVNAETGRTRDGRGRVGVFGYARDGTGRAEQQGRETWNRPEPRIHAVVPVFDQMALNGARAPRFPYPFDSGGRLLSPLADRRTLLVIGDNLPTEVGEPVQLESLDGAIGYRVVAKQHEFDEPTFVKPLVERAWARTREAMTVPGSRRSEAEARRRMAEYRKKDAILIEARVKPGIVPGKTGFTLNGGEAAWTLRFGDFVGEIVAARPVNGHDADAIDVAVAPERIQFEIRTTAAHPLNRLPVTISKGPEFKTFEGRQKVWAELQPFDPLDVALVNQARRNGNDAKLIRTYRTPPLALVTADAPDLMPDIAGDFRLQVAAGDTIRAAVGERGLLATTKPYARLSVVTSPAEVGPTIYQRMRSDGISLRAEAAPQTGVTWTLAMTEAARCAGVPPVDLPLLAQRQAASVRDWIWTEIPWAVFRVSGEVAVLDAVAKQFGVNFDWWFGRTDPDIVYSIAVKLGDHAGMIMIRDIFVEMMEIKLEELRSIDEDSDVWAFRRGMETAITAVENHPVGDMVVAAPDGSQTYFFTSYVDDVIRDDFGVTDLEEKSRWQLAAAREAVTQYRRAVLAALQRARDVKVCDIKAMLELTGLGFDNVIDQALKRLVIATPTRGGKGDEWHTDHAARTWVQGLGILAEAVRRQGQLSETDTELFAIASFVGVGGTALVASLAGYESLAIAWAAYAEDVIDLSRSVYSSVSDLLASKDELAFARGASAVAGPTRYVIAEEQEQDWAFLLLRESPNFLSAVGSVAETPSLISRTWSAYKGRRLLATAAVPGTVRPAPPGLRDAPTEAVDSDLFEARLLDPVPAGVEAAPVIDPAPAPPRRNFGPYNDELAQAREQGLAREVERIEKLAGELHRLGVDDAEFVNILNNNLPDGDALRDGALLDVIDDMNLAMLPRLGFNLLEVNEQIEMLSRFSRLRSGDLDPGDLPWLANQIEAARLRGKDYFDELANRGTYLPNEGFLPIAGEGLREALREVARREGLLTDTFRVGPKPTEAAAVKTLEDLDRLDRVQRRNVFDAMWEARRLEREVGRAGMTEAQRRALDLSETLLGQQRGIPPWARDLGPGSYARIKHMRFRPDVQRLAMTDANRLRAVINDPVGLDVLERQPWRSVGELQEAIEKAKRRVRQPVEGFFESTQPRPDEHVLEGMEIEDRVLDRAAAFDVEDGAIHSHTRMQLDGKLVADFERDLYSIDLPDGGSGKELVLKFSQLDDAPKFLQEAGVKLVPDRGTPLATFLNVRAFHNLKLGFADPRLKRVRLSDVQAVDTEVQVHWMRKVYGEEELDRYLRHTPSVLYTESALNQAGFRIAGVRMDRTQKSILNLAGVEVAGPLYNGTEDAAAFLERFGVAPGEKIQIGFDLLIDVLPF